MEASQQQRRPTIGQSAQRLRQQLGLDLDALDLADAFWLAQFTELEGSSPLPEPSKSSTQDTPVTRGADSDPPSTRDKPDVNLYIDNRPTSDSASDADESEAEDRPQTPPFPVPAAPALRTRLDLGRSLRPLMRKVPSRLRQELDEAATVSQIAETRLWIPVLRPQPERWLDLDLVVEDSKTTIIWERTIAELEQLLTYQGAFRTLRTWRLAVPDLATSSAAEIKLFPRWRDAAEKHAAQRPRSPRELLDPSGRRLVLLLTDCTSSLWWRGLIQEILWAWAEVQPVSIMQLFPERLWTRTALKMGHIVRLGATAPGLANARLEVVGLPQQEPWELEDEIDPDAAWTDPVAVPDPRRLVLPIVTLEPQPLQRWARVMAGSGHQLTPGRVFELYWVQQMAQEQSSDPAAKPPTARQRVARFRATASNLAQQLAGYMAATPVSLPVIDLLRDEFVPDARQDHVAEVLLSGLLQRCDPDQGDEPCRYEFFGDREPVGSAGRVRDLLLDSVPMSHSRQVLDWLSRRIGERAGYSLKSFEAFLAAFEKLEEDLTAGALPLAQVGLDVLHRLGGSHAALARRYESVRHIAQGRPTSSDWPALKTEEFTVVTFEVEPDVIPGLSISFDVQPYDVPPEVTPTFTLETFDFTVVTLHRSLTQQPTRTQESVEWVIQRQQQQAHRFVEPLLRDISLEMVAIPGGSFVMGSPEDEPGRYDNESPQHQVTVSPFFIGRYPVTQAQWQAVASMPPVEKALEPDPSRFKGDNRPVERVSWHDIMEFCARLSVQTGRKYRLPSEAEWEYACRAGTTTPFHFGETITTEVANYNGSYTYNRGLNGDDRQETIPVHYFGIANAFGLSDMHGNVFEWCLDHWHGNYDGVPTDGSACVSKGDRSRLVVRGGSWFNFPSDCRSAYRSSDYAYACNHSFRIVSVASKTL